MSVLPSPLKSPENHSRWLGSEIQLQGAKVSAICCEMVFCCELAVRCCRDEADCAFALDPRQARELPANKVIRVRVSRTRATIRRVLGCCRCQDACECWSVSTNTVMNPFTMCNLSGCETRDTAQAPGLARCLVGTVRWKRCLPRMNSDARPGKRHNAVFSITQSDLCEGENSALFCSYLQV